MTTRFLFIGFVFLFVGLYTPSILAFDARLEKVTLDSMIVPPIILGDTILCPRSASILDVGEDYAEYEWNVGFTTHFIPVREAGMYSVTVTDFNGCTASTSVNVSIYDFELPEIFGGDFICLNGELRLFIEQDYETIVWSNGEEDQDIIINSSGNYFVRVTDSNGCTGVSAIYINQYEFTETYSFEITCRAEFEDVIVEEFIDGNGCDALNLHHITLDTTTTKCMVDFEVVTSDLRCGESNGRIEIFFKDGFLDFNIEVFNQDGDLVNESLISDLDQTVIMTDLPSGEYDIRITNEYDMLIEQSVALIELDPISFEFQEEFELQIGQAAELSIIADPLLIDTINWYDQDSVLLCSNCNNFSIVPEDSSSFLLEVIDINSCIYRERIDVNILSIKDIYIPNVFRPKSAVGNERFRPYGPGLKQLNIFEVYDRWGNLVHHETGSEIEGWDGSADGLVMQPGLYAYLIEVEYFDGVTAQFNGAISLIR